MRIGGPHGSHDVQQCLICQLDLAALSSARVSPDTDTLRAVAAREKSIMIRLWVLRGFGHSTYDVNLVIYLMIVIEIGWVERCHQCFWV